MPRRLIFHCGPPKTGTSAVQALLRDASPPGLTYPATGQWPDGAHHMLTFAHDGLAARGDIEIPPWSDLAEPLAAELDAADGDVLISSELLTAATLGAFQERIQSATTRRFDEVRTIITLRHPLERAASSYNQVVKDPVTAETRLPDVYLSRAGPTFRIGPLIRAWQAAPHPVLFLGYHPAESLVERFMDLVGHPLVGGDVPDRRNASINGYGLVAYLAAGRLGLSNEERARLNVALRADRNQRIWSGPSFPFSRDTARRFLAEVVEPDLADAAALTGIDLRGLHTDPPQRFVLTAPQRRAIRDKFATLDLAKDQYRKLNWLLGAFS